MHPHTAIEFILSDKYKSISAQRRRELLHESGAAGIVSAYAEIVFDNSDKRMVGPARVTSKGPGADVVIKRTVGAKKDEFFLNGKHSTRLVIRNILEACGLSSEHFIVAQGKVRQRVLEKDEDRLTLLKEIAGTRIYDSRKEDCFRILGDADHKRENVQDVVDCLRERLGHLEGEKDELSKFEKKDSKRKMLEYALYSKEKASSEEQLASLEDKGREKKDGEALQSTLEATKAELASKLKRRNERRRKREDLNTSLHPKGNRLTALSRTLQDTELMVEELGKSVEKTQKERETCRKELEEIEEQIRENQSKLEEVLPDFAEKQAEVKEAEDSRQSKESRLAYVCSFYETPCTSSQTQRFIREARTTGKVQNKKRQK